MSDSPPLAPVRRAVWPTFLPTSMKTLFSHAWLAVFLGYVVAGPLALAAEPAADPAAPISYHKQIRPIFQAHCQGCHQPAKKGGEYVMTVFATLLKGGESDTAAIVPGDPDKSELLSQITPSDKNEAEMPKGKPPLSEPDRKLIRTWIAQGAIDDSPAATREVYDMEHPPVYEAAPVLTSIDYSKDGLWLAVSGYHEVLLWNADGSALAGRLVGMSERIQTARFSPDGKRLAVAGGSPGRFGEVQVWDVEKRQLTLSHPVCYDTVYGASWSSDGKLVAFGGPDNIVRAIEADTGKQVLFNGSHNDWVLDTTFSSKSDHVISVSRDMSMRLTEVATQRFIDNITSITPGALKGGLCSVDCHPAKDELLCGGSDGSPKIFRMLRTSARKIGDNANLIKEYEKMPGRIWSVTYSADGNQFAAGSSNDGVGQVRIYNVADGKVIAKLDVPESGIYSVAFSPDGKTVAAGGFDGDIRLIGAADGALVKRFTPMEIKK